MKPFYFSFLALALLSTSARATNRIWQVAMPRADADSNTGSPTLTENAVAGPTFSLNPATARVIVVIYGTYEAYQRAEAYTNPFFYAEASSLSKVRWFLRGSSGGNRSSNVAEFSPFGTNAWTNFGTSLYPMQTFYSQLLPRVNLDVSHFSAAQKANVKLILSGQISLSTSGAGNAQGALHFLTIPNYVTLEFDASGAYLG